MQNNANVAEKTVHSWRNGGVIKKSTRDTANMMLKMSNSQHISVADNIKTKPMHTLNADDTLRISKIIRHLLDETNASAAIELCKKLEVAVNSPTNAQYVCRSFQRLAENMLTLIKLGPVECAEYASTILGMMCYINRADFYRWQRMLFEEFERCNSNKLKKYIMLTLKAILSYDANNLELAPHSVELMANLKDCLENAAIAKDFMVVSEEIVDFAKYYTHEFENHFTDIVDIIVGWHLEVEQLPALKMYCSIVLQKLAPYFMKEHNFTYGLLGQFLEDIAVCGENVIDEIIGNEERQQAEKRFGAFVGTFNTIIKTLANKMQLIDFAPYSGEDIINRALIIITSTAIQTLGLKLSSEETVINLNEFLYLIYSNYKRLVACNSNNTQTTVNIIELQIQQYQLFSDQQKFSLFNLVFCVVQELGNSLPISMIRLIFNEKLKLTRNKRLCKLLLRIYHEVLLLKNVRLVQKAYPYLTDSLQLTFPLSGDDPRATTVLFNVAAVSVLATQTSSMISMHALNPSIFQYLLNQNYLSRTNCWAMHPTLHSAMLRVLVLHCQKHRQFLDSSFMINERFMSTQSGSNFSNILATMNNYLLCYLDYDNPVPPNMHILLEWIHTLLKQCKQSASVLWHEESFVNLCQRLCQPEIVFRTKLPLQHATCIQVLLDYMPPPPDNLLQRIYQLAHTMLLRRHGQQQEQVQRVYTQILACLPLVITLTPPLVSVQSSQLRNVQQLHEWYKAAGQNATLRSKYFKPLLESIDVTPPFNNVTKAMQPPLEQFFSGYFKRCWTLNATVANKSAEYLDFVQTNDQLLYAWLQHEAARYCVRNKLRTVIGKPQETFLTIEAIIMRYARLITLKSTLSSSTVITSKKNGLYTEWLGSQILLARTRHVLGFLEELEKCIYNAAEGCAFAMLPVEKAAKTFFRINAHTCHEWFKRINAGVCLIALHSMQPEMAVRYCENLFRTESLQGTRLENTAVTLTWSLLNCGDSDALHGLYAYTGRRYIWIQYAAEQACGRRELAAEGYATVLSDADNDANVNTKIDTYLREFLTEQLYECLYSTAQWKKLRTMQLSWSHQPRRAEHLEAMEMLCFGHDAMEDNLSKLLTLTEWDTTQRAPTNSSGLLLRQLEDVCMAQVVNNEDNENLTVQLCVAVQGALLENLSHATFNDRYSNVQTNCLILNHMMMQLLSPTAAIKLDTDTYIKAESGVLLKSLLWSNLLAQRSHTTCAPNTMYLNIAAAARREGNSLLCRSMLERFFVLKGFDTTLTNIAEQLQSNSYKLDIKDAILLRGFSELTECVNATQYQMEAIELGAAYCRQIVQHLHVEVEETAPSINAASAASRMLLRLAEWLQSQRSSNSSASCNTPQLQYLLACLPTDDHINTSDASHIPTVERAVGRLINGSIVQRSDIADAWYAYGNLCYRWGKRAAETRASADIGGICMQERNAIRDLLHGDAQLSLLDQIEHMLNDQTFNTHDPSISKEEERTEETDGEYESPETIDDYNSSERLKSELLKLNALDGEQITTILRIWRQTHSNVYYETATRAYFQYLAISADDLSKTDSQFEKTTTNTMDCIFVTTTLRILRLIVKHALGLQEALEESLHTTPMRPWKAIIPQLFSRLNHHEPYVRKIVAELLCKLSEEYSNLVFYPAIIGAMQERPPATPDAATALEYNLQQCSSNKKVVDNNIPHSNRNTFNGLLQACGLKTGRDVVELQKLVQELKRITLLWEEYWLHSLAQVYADYAPLFNTLELQTKQNNNAIVNRVSHDVTGLNTHYSIIIEHLIADLRRIAAVTQCEPQSIYERNFQERYNSFIDSTISALQDDYQNALNNSSTSKPNESWLRLKQLYGIFQQRALRTNAVTLKLTDLSPWLTKLRGTNISMPGEQCNFISSVDSSVHILPTKTRPKKLAFIGDNGSRYTYLFKGLEDLHLDERIMQFLSIANSMMARQSEQTAIGGTNLRAQHYSVIPLGRQSGIIRWVDGMTPLFSIYKKWQQRDTALKQLQKERHHTNIQLQQLQQAATSATATSTAAAATRPSELFYGKLAPLLAEHNLKISDPRKQWPLPVLRRVLTELTNDTPRDLLAKELWCCALNAAEWRQVVRNYAASTAVMSVIGYVIGLGDRHLDNILIRLSSGEILHIDYNVCFEKGKTLRVPEKVPFRMTPNIEEALGLTGIEGTFRLTCEQVMRILRKERETLLTLLEAFVYDPLIDWTLNDEGAAASTRITSAHVAAMRIECYQNVACSTTTGTTTKITPEQLSITRGDWFSQNIIARFNKFKPSWLKFNDEIESELVKIETNLDRLISSLELTRHEELERDSLNKQLAMVHELETLGTAMGSHALNTVSARYASYKRDAETFHAIKSRVQLQHNKAKEHISHINGGEGELTALNQHLLTLESDATSIYELRQQMELNEIEGPCSELKYCFNLLIKHGYIRQYEPRARQQQRNPLIQCERWYRQLLENELDAATLQLKIFDWHRNINDISSEESNIALAYATDLEKVAMTLSTQETQLSNNLNELQKTPTLNLTTNALRSFLCNDITTSNDAINTLQCFILQTIKEQNDKFIFVDSNLATLDNPLLDSQLEHIEFVLTVCHIVPLPSDTDSSELLSTVSLLDATLKSINALKCAFELPLLKRIVQLFMRNDDDELQQLMQLMCNPTLRSQELFNTVSCGTAAVQTDGVGDLHVLLQDISRVFADVETKLTQLYAAARTLFRQQQPQLPPNLKQLESKIFNKHVRFTIEKWKYDVIAQVFDSTYRLVNAMNTHNIQNIYDIRDLRMPILKYVCHVENSYLAGLTSLFTYALHSQLTMSLPVNATVHNKVHVELLWSTFVEAINREIVMKKLQQQQELYANWLEHHNDIFAAYCWSNDIDCTAFSVGKQFTITALQSSHQLLDKLQGIFVHYHTTLEMLVKRKPEQMLELLSLELTRSHFYVELCTRLSDHTEALLCCKRFDEAEILMLVEKWQLSYGSWRRSGALITPVEQALVQLLDPEGNIDTCWIKNITGLLDEMIYATQRKLTTLEQEVSLFLEQLNANSQKLQLFSDAQERALVCHLFKLMLKSNHSIYSNVSTLHRKDRHCHSKLGRLQLQLQYLERDSGIITLVQIRADTGNLRELLIQNRQELLKFMQQLISGETQQSSTNATYTKSNNSQLNNFSHTDKKISSNQNEQKRNAYAVSVWKRIRMKLEGRDSAPNSRTSVPEQVDFIIREAMNTDNLAVLYEGWTPWV